MVVLKNIEQNEDMQSISFDIITCK